MGTAPSKFSGWLRREASYPQQTSTPSSSSSSAPLCNESEKFNSEAAQTYESSYCSSSSYAPYSYDVFLSFRGTDTRATFTSHLYLELDRDGIRTFIDDEELRKGQEIACLFEAIDGSRISIPILSRNYASSKWCLDELVKIMECKDQKGQKVLPIFYHVDPRDVRHQTGSFDQPFQQHAQKFDPKKVASWKEALKQAGGLKGWEIKDDGNESELIQRVVKYVRYELRETSCDVHEDLVGINSRVKELLNLLNLESKDVKILGIWGMGGIGKTTIAKAVFNKILHKFDSCIFLEDVKEVSEQPRGLVRLQKEFLSALLNRKIKLISNLDEGKSFIKKSLHAKKVLIVLDNVDHIEQLKALIGPSDWFGKGSKIIITTRDEHMLNLYKVHEIHKVKELNYNESLQLFCKHAFGKDQPLDDFLELARDIVFTAGGLPLALLVLGSLLYDKRSKQIWKSALERLKKIPHESIEGKLRISYDELHDFDKEIFLDIACFFNGIDKEYAVDIWEGCGFSPEVGIENLIQRSLVKISDFGSHKEIRMHDQLRDMGRHIVHQESPNEPGKRSRLWSHEDVLDVLKGQEGTRAVQGIVLKFEEEESALGENHFSTEEFEAMSKLRILQIDNVHLVGDFSKLPSELRWLSWKGCPLGSMPTDFHLKKLVVLDLSYSRIKQVWNDLDENKYLEELTVLNLNGCQLLTETPDFSSLPNVKKLSFEGCLELRKLTPSICNLKSLKKLVLSGCSNLNKLPDLRGSLEELKVLKLDNEKSLCRSPDLIGNMRNLMTLSLEGTSITELPNDIGLLEKMEVLNASNCKNLVKLPDSMAKMMLLREFYIDETGIVKLPEDFGMLSRLQRLSMDYCREFRGFPENFASLVELRSLYIQGNTKLAMLPNSFSSLCSLQNLDASRCNFSEDGIPGDFWKLSSLASLNLSYNNFRTLPKMPSRSLRNLYLGNCVSLESISDMSDLKLVETLSLSNCEKLVDIQGVEEMKYLRELWTSGCCRALVNCMTKCFGQGLLQPSKQWTFPGSKIPDCFTPLKLIYYSPRSIRDKFFQVDCEGVPILGIWGPIKHQKIIGLLLCFVVRNLPVDASSLNVLVYVERNGRCSKTSLAGSCRSIFPSKRHQDQTCLLYYRDNSNKWKLEDGDEISFEIKIEPENVEIQKDAKFQFVSKDHWHEVEVHKAGMHVVYEEMEQSTIMRIGDLFTHSSHDDVMGVDGCEPSSSRKRAKIQMLDQDKDGDDVDDGVISRKKKRVPNDQDHEDEDYNGVPSILKEGV